jgi:hypothetical protein
LFTQTAEIPDIASDLVRIAGKLRRKCYKRNGFRKLYSRVEPPVHFREPHRQKITRGADITQKLFRGNALNSRKIALYTLLCDKFCARRRLGTLLALLHYDKTIHHYKLRRIFCGKISMTGVSMDSVPRLRANARKNDV